MHLRSHLLTLLIMLAAMSAAGYNARWKMLDMTKGAYNEQVQRICEDSDGLMWFGTRYGLSSYDGYRVRTYYPTHNNGHVEISNNILDLDADDKGNIYFVSRNGFGRFDKNTHEISITSQSDIWQTLSSVTVLRSGQVLVGYSPGVLAYDAQADKMRPFEDLGVKGELPTGAVKAIVEDALGQVWIGTWGNGLYRYSPREGMSYRYPKLNESDNAYVIFNDSKNNIWIGTWDNGLYRLNNAYDQKNVKWDNFNTTNSALPDNRIYSISEDPYTGNIWVGMRSGLVVITPEGEFEPLRSPQKGEEFDLKEVDHVFCDSRGIIWLATIGEGIATIDTKPKLFEGAYLPAGEAKELHTLIPSILIDKRGHEWFGLGSYGIAHYDPDKGTYDFPYYELGFPNTSAIYAIYDIAESKNGDIWFGSYAGDIVRYDPVSRKAVAQYHASTSEFIPGGNVRRIKEDSAGNLWVGTYNGVGVLTADGRQLHINNLESAVYDLAEMPRGMAFATSDNGLWLARITADGLEAQPVSNGSAESSLNILCLYTSDNGTLYVGTEGEGLWTYDGSTLKHSELLSDHADMRIMSIIEDNDGGLWLGSNLGLWYIGRNYGAGEYLHFNKTTGLPSDIFTKAVFADGERMLMGTGEGAVSFVPCSLIEHYADDKPVEFGFSRLYIDNHNLETYDKDMKQRFTDGLAVGRADKLQLPYSYNSFAVEFAALTYLNPELTRYAYKLEGFDDDWIYADASSRSASYTNLPPGEYEFKLRASNECGLWSPEEKSMKVVILPPWYRTGWAYATYAVLALALLTLAIVIIRKKSKRKERAKLMEMKQQKADEVNHSKLVFFTNITHELLTPLTIISAAVDELKTVNPEQKGIYKVVDVNVSRLIRLIQQILEFRKAESKNLRLKAYKGDLNEYVKREVDAFGPLIRKKSMALDYEAPSEPVIGYFDPDKIDKILYNLMSNAAKYTPDNGIITVSLRPTADGESVELRVSDTGKGIEKSKQATLFTRFYDGDYREFRTIGTGIGLSLTHDLVELHHGSISVESEPGKGTTFIVTIPIAKDAYRADEIQADGMPSVLGAPTQLPESEGEVEQAPSEDRATILIVEDNDELLDMMVKLMRHEYNVTTARNGQEALDKIKQEMPDLIITDIMMPVMDGKEMTEKIKNDIDTSHIPIIVLTAKSATEDQAEMYDIGADSYLTKPFDLNVLHSRMKNLLRRRISRADDFKNQLVVQMKELDYDSLDEKFITRAIECIERHIADTDFDVPQFAEELAVSKTTLYNKLKSLTGLSPSSFIRNIRLKMSCKIMNEHADIRISELAFMVGFNDPKYFSNCFKKEFGMSPSAYCERFLSHDID